MKKLLKKVDFGSAIIGVAATGVGAVAAAYTNKMDIVQQHLDTPMKRGLAKLAVGALLPIGVQVIAKKIPPKVMHGITAFSDGFVAIAAVEIANATVFKSAPIALSGVPFATLSGTEDLYPVKQFSTLENQSNNAATAVANY